MTKETEKINIADIVPKLVKDDKFNSRYNLTDLSKYTYYDTTIVSANKKGTHSTVIPKPILKKLGLQKGQVLGWDIKGNDIVITPMGNDLILADTLTDEILRDMLSTNRFNQYYTHYSSIMGILDKSKDELSNEDKLAKLNIYFGNQLFDTEDEQERFMRVVKYLLLSDLPKAHHNILTKFYKNLQTQ